MGDPAAAAGFLNNPGWPFFGFIYTSRGPARLRGTSANHPKWQRDVSPKRSLWRIGETFPGLLLAVCMLGCAPLNSLTGR